MKRITRRAAVHAAAVCLLAGLYGCGDSGGSGSTSTTPATTQSVGSLVLVEGGTAAIGDPAPGTKISNDTPVTVSNFYISKYEITFDEWDAYTKSTGKPDVVDFNNSGRGQNPVYNIDWYDAVEYTNWRSLQEGLAPVYTIDKTSKDPNNHATDTADPKKWIVTADWTANGYRLPTEAEWEYAAKGGKLTKGYKYPGSNSLKEVAWYGGKAAASATTAGGATLANFSSATVTRKGDMRRIGSLKANELGLHDMAGNVSEWVWDKYSTARTGTTTTGYSKSSTVNPKGHTIFNKFIFRGGNSGGRFDCMIPTKRFTKDVTFTMCPAGLRLARSK